MKLTPFSTDLRDGQSVLVREVTPEDRHLLEIGYEHLSAQSRYYRFLAARHDLTVAELDVFTASNGPDHVAVGALIEDAAGSTPVGIARYVRLPDKTNMAEIAITISDSHQHLGLGSILLGVLAKFAVLDGISEFTALVHAENKPMLRLLGQLGAVQTHIYGAEVEVAVPIAKAHAAGQLTSPSVAAAFGKIEEIAIIA